MKKPSRTGMIAHELGISTWFGGTLFGQLSLNPTVSSISDQRKRGRISSEAWARFQAANLPPCSRRCSDGDPPAGGTTRSCRRLA